MRDASCVEFLKWSLPQLGLAWPGFRRVHRQVCKRVGRRLRELHLADSRAYRDYLESNPAEWDHLAAFCRIPISRFFRDRAVFDCLAQKVLPALAETAVTQGATVLGCWSAGCAAGEEPYSLNILWHSAVSADFPTVSFNILATDVDEHQLERARAGLYRESSLREVPQQWRETAFQCEGQLCRLRESFRSGVTFERQDLLQSVPLGPFDVVLCRNVVFTYFSDDRRKALLPRLCAVLRPGGALVIGIREHLPADIGGLIPWFPELGIFRNAGVLAFGRTAPIPEVDAHQ